MTVRVVLADDHPIFRDGLVRSLEEGGRFAVVGAGGTADEAVALAAEHRPDLVLLDISMPGGGIDAAAPHRRHGPAAPHRHADGLRERPGRDRRAEGPARSATSSRASPRSSSTDILAGVAAGEAHVSPALAARILNDIEKPAATPAAARSTTSASARRTSCAGSPAA